MIAPCNTRLTGGQCSCTPAAITYQGHRFEGAEAKYRGRTSLEYPKKSFTLKFAKTDRFNDPERLPGFVRKRKLTLTTTFDDNSYLRARLAFQLWTEPDSPESGSPESGSGSPDIETAPAPVHSSPEPDAPVPTLPD